MDWQKYYSSIGILLDVIGVILLTIDLVRVQASLKQRAKSSLSHLDELSSDYGGIEGWAADIEKQARWVSQHEYSDHHAEDEVSFNAGRQVSNLKDMANCVGGLAAHLSRLMMLYSRQAEEDQRAAKASITVSIWGLGLIGLGFILQLIGTWPGT